MQQKPFFIPQFFHPTTCKILSKFCSPKEGEQCINLRFYADTELKIVQYEAPSMYTVFIPNIVLNKPYHFGKISSSKQKQVILNLFLEESDFLELINRLGGTARKKRPADPTLGTLLDRK